jgi:Family of unknown function (DUF6526)
MDPLPQTYATHRQLVPLFHVVLSGTLLVTLIGAGVNLYESLGDSQRLYSASLILVQTVALLLLYYFCRAFPLKAQDRAIRAEEQLRHYVLAGRLPDARLTIGQFVALRFASDGEVVALAQRAADQAMTPDAIKREIKTWRADTYRV